MNQPIEKVWEFLSNPEKVVTCVPGAKLTEKVDDTHYKGTVSLKFGPVAASYNGQISIDELDDEQHIMKISGKGMDTKGKGSAGMVMDGQLTAKGPDLTEVGYKMEISVSGKLAQFGSRLIVDVSNQLADQFVSSFKAALETAPAPAAEAAAVREEAAAEPKDNAVNVFALIIGVIKAFFGRLFSSKPKQS